ncbi:uncharacterized protein J4E87_006711 [Alternaria ethzedia]|uniref:uncharacterized protein n=1 Tax=Alternaria ethzedia TaxID=181014 RepID=UPI0020C1E3EE|nr:uncharacterized protein J4E87_006711 [Alternaria ethzedia]KAI4621494.1 hypothetical protein J4E87_006711 [Alternaria ethzedia]
MEDDDMDASLDGPMSKRAKKIDRIEDRLAGIENVLASLATKLGSLDLQKDSHESSSQSRSSRVGPSRSPGSVLVEAPTPAPFEGESSINSQSDYAREMLARAIGSTPSIGQNEEVKLALTALSEMVSQHGQNPATSNPLINQSLVDIDPSKLERPPWEIACYALEKASVVFPFLRMANLKEIFYDVYHNPETCSAARRVLTFGVLENVFNEFRTLPLVNMDTTNYQSYAIISRRQTEVALSQLAIFLPASYENIMALVLGAAQAVEMCKPSLCWIMISSAAGLCQSLGYTKIHIFWMIYMLDKTLSLRLGRSSILQDWDISLPFVVSSDPNDKHAESSAFLSYWIKVARVQGLTYEKLFCPAAFTRSTEERTRIAIELVNSLNQAWYERGDASIVDFSQQGQTYHLGTPRSNKIGNSPNETPLPSQYKRYVHKSQGKQGSEVNEYVQGNMSFNQECLESSRAALVAHMRASAQFNKKGQEDLWSGYVHWSVLQAPFTPFIVIFCHSIQKADTSDVEPDLNSLSEFVGSLESCRTISEGADKLYKMCHLFLRVARLYVTAKKQDAASRSRGVMQNNQSGYYTTVDGTQLDLNAMSQFDPYLSALGLMPDTAWPTTYPNASTAATTTAFEQGEAMNNMDAVGSSGFGFGASQGNSNPMQDWFSGSRYLMNLMEPGDDLQMPDLDL